MTVMVLTDDTGLITSTPPIVAKFYGQHIDNLRRWLMKQPGYIERIYPSEKEGGKTNA